MYTLNYRLSLFCCYLDTRPFKCNNLLDDESSHVFWFFIIKITLRIRLTREATDTSKEHSNYYWHHRLAFDNTAYECCLNAVMNAVMKAMNTAYEGCWFSQCLLVGFSLHAPPLRAGQHRQRVISKWRQRH